jgi:hypothetical protein
MTLSERGAFAHRFLAHGSETTRAAAPCGRELITSRLTSPDVAGRFLVWARGHHFNREFGASGGRRTLGVFARRLREAATQ